MNHRLLIIIIASLAVTVAFGQASILEDIVKNDRNFYEVKAEMRTRIAEDPSGKLAKHWGRLENYLEPRVFPHGNIVEYQSKARRAKEKFIKYYSTQQRATHGSWTFMGPNSSPSGSFGRCLEIEFVAGDPATFFVLTSSAGLWKTTNNGTTWINLTSELPLLYCVDFEVDQSDIDNIYLFTGNDRQTTGGFMFTRGILKTNNGGLTWEEPGFEFFGSVWPYRLVMHPDPDSASSMYSASSQGIHKTEDGWQTATRVLSLPDGESARDIEFKPGDPSTMYAASGQRVFRSTQRGDFGTWVQVVDEDFSGLDSMFRMELAIAPSNPSCVYLVASDNQADYILRSLNSGEDNSWTMQDDTSNLFWGQASYNMDIVVDPTDFTILHVGAIALWRSTNGGRSWSEIQSTYIDHHRLKYKGSVLYDLNDGGVGRSPTGVGSWSNITAGIGVFEAYDVTGTPQDATLVYTGGQDTGGNRIDPGGSYVRVLPLGDITMCMQHPSDTLMAYMAAQGGGLRYTFDAWETDFNAGPGTDGQNFEPEFGGGVWVCPYIMDNTNPLRVFTGKDSIWRLDVIAETSQWLGYPKDGRTRKIVQGVDNTDRLYVIHGDSLFRTDDAMTTSPAGATWTFFENDFGEVGWMSDIDLNPDNADEIYVTYSGTSAGNKVFFSDSAGLPGSWENISGNLPNVPILDIAFHDNGLGNHAIYVGTELGVFYRDDSLTDWIYFSNGMPNTPVTKLYINTGSNEIVAATLGRGVWKSELYSVCPTNINLGTIGLNSGVRYYSANTFLQSSRGYDGAFYTDINYKAGSEIRLLPGFRMKTPGVFTARLGGCPDLLD